MSTEMVCHIRAMSAKRPATYHHQTGRHELEGHEEAVSHDHEYEEGGDCTVSLGFQS